MYVVVAVVATTSITLFIYGFSVLRTDSVHGRQFFSVFFSNKTAPNVVPPL
jgi:hypothetical protein